MDVMKVYRAGSLERARLIAAKDVLEAYTGEDFVIREVVKGKETYCRSLDSNNDKDKWTTIMRRRKQETLYRTCLTPEQQEKIVGDNFDAAFAVLKEVMSDDGKKI